MTRALLILLLPLAVACTRSEDPALAPGPVVAQAAAAPPAAAKSVTLLITGDVGGKYAPCSCPSNPSGGLPRRSKLVEEQRARGPTVVLDAGDLLFPRAGKPTDADLARAELLIEAAGAFGTAALGVGDRDLANGLGWLLERAKKAKVSLVSANLSTVDGKRPFEPHRMISAGGIKVGVTGLWLSNGLRPPAGFIAADPVETAKAEASAMRNAGADVVVVLAHGPLAGAREVAAVEGIDLVVPSHVGSSVSAHRAGGGYVVGAGHEGRSVLKVDLSLGGSGPLANGDALDRARREIGYLTSAADSTQRLLDAAKTPEEKATRARALDDYRTRIDALKAEMATPVPSNARTFFSRPKGLDPRAPEDPIWVEKVRRLEERYPAAAR